MNHRMSRFSPRALCMRAVAPALVCLMAAQPAWAATVEYRVRNSFEHQPGGPGQVWRGAWSFGGNADAASSGCSMHRVYGPRTAPLQSDAVGLALQGVACPETGPIAAEAIAGSSIHTNAFGVGTALVGSTESSGIVITTPTAGGFPAAGAASHSGLVLESGLPNGSGSIVWAPSWETRTAGSALADSSFNDRARAVIPVDYTLRDAATKQVLLQGQLVKTTGLLIGSLTRDSMMAWDSRIGEFRVDAMDADFSIEMNSPFSVQGGSLFLQIRDGLVTRADDEGVFDGMLPAPGTPGDVVLPLGAIDLDFDFGDLGRFGSRELELALHFGGEGDARSGRLLRVALPGTLTLLWLPLLAVGRGARCVAATVPPSDMA